MVHIHAQRPEQESERPPDKIHKLFAKGSSAPLFGILLTLKGYFISSPSFVRMEENTEVTGSPVIITVLAQIPASARSDNRKAPARPSVPHSLFHLPVRFFLSRLPTEAGVSTPETAGSYQG